MRNIAITVFCVLLMSLCVNAEEPNIAESRSKVKRISANETYKKFHTGNIMLVDAMSLHDYNKRHILGSINIPNDGLKDIIAFRNMPLSFPTEQEIVIYCY